MRPFESILEDWCDWPMTAKPILRKKFTQGLNHETALLSVGRDQFVLKRFLGGPERQIESQLWAASIGIAPEIIFAPPNHEYVLMEAIADNHLVAGKIDNISLQTIAQGLSTMHAAKPGPKSARGFDIRVFCNSYLNAADEKAAKLHKQMTPALDQFHNDATPWVFCHNDLVTANCFISGGVAQFIDWEYADLHNPWFDLAAVIFYFELSDAQAKVFLNSYRIEWGVKISEPIFYTAQLSLLWGDMLWHLDKYGFNYWNELTAKEQRLASLLEKANRL